MALSMVQNQDYSHLLGESKAQKEFMDRYRVGLRARVHRERDWYIAREFLRGNQYAVWIEGRGIIEPPRDSKWLQRPKLVYNYCRTIVETLLAYLLRQEPTFITVARTGEAEDQAAAMVGRQVLYHYWDQLALGRMIERLGMWTLTCGKGVAKVGWNPLAGPVIPVRKLRSIPPMPLPPELAAQVNSGAIPLQSLPAQFWQPRTIEEIVGERQAGDVDVQLLSPFEFIADPGAETIDQASWAMHATMRPVDEMKALYPQFADRLTPEAGGQSEMSYARRALQAFGGGSTHFGRLIAPEQLKRVLVIEAFHRSGKEYPEGLRLVMTRNVVLDAGSTPPGYDEIPFSDWDDRIVPGEFWSDGTLKDLVPMQKELNKRVSQLVDIANKYRVKWMAPIGAVDESQINNEDGEVIEHQPGQRPEPVNPPPFPDGPVRLISLTREAMENQSAVQSILQGRVEGEVRSGRQVAYLGQYGETRVGLLAKHLARFLERLGRLILTQVKDNVTEPRIGKIVGRNRQVETFYFKGADLRGNTDVRVETGSLLGFSKQERFDKLMRMHQEGIIGPEKVMSSMEMEDFYPIIEEKAQDRNNALRENEQWRRGEQARRPFYFDDHVEHLSVHNSFRKSAIYEAMAPWQRLAIDEHCASHERFMAPQVQPQAQTPGAAPAEPGAGPTLPPAPAAEEIPPGLEESAQELSEGLPPVPPLPQVGGEHGPG